MASTIEISETAQQTRGSLTYWFIKFYQEKVSRQVARPFIMQGWDTEEKIQQEEAEYQRQVDARLAGDYPEHRQMALHRTAALGYLPVEIPEARWVPLPIEAAKHHWDAGLPLLIFFGKFWKVPSGAGGEDPCWLYKDQSGVYTTRNWNAWANPGIDVLFGKGGKDTGYMFFGIHQG